MGATITFDEMYSLDQVTFIGGTSYNFKFIANDNTGSPIDLATAVLKWRLAPFGTDYAIVDKTGNLTSSNTFEVLLTPTDTANLSGKFVQQPIIQFANGRDSLPAQGVVTISKGIK